MEIRNTDPSRLFLVTKGGAGLSFEHRCSHGGPAISLHLFSERNGTSEDIGVLLPTCIAPSLFGGVLAFLESAHGTEAADEFMEDMLAAKERTLQLITARRERMEAAEQACCQAGFYTQGREHTCRPTDTPA